MTQEEAPHLRRYSLLIFVGSRRTPGELKTALESQTCLSPSSIAASRLCFKIHFQGFETCSATFHGMLRERAVLLVRFAGFRETALRLAPLAAPPGRAAATASSAL